MADTWRLLSRYAEAWRDLEMEEAEAGRVELGALFGVVAAKLDRQAHYAFEVHQLLTDGDGTFARNAAYLEAMEREGFPWARAPRELPQREQSENN